MRRAVAYLPYLANLTGLREGKRVLHTRPPRDGPVDHQPLARSIGGLQELICTLKIGGEGFFDEHMPAAFEGFHSFLRPGAVVAKKANRIERVARSHLGGIRVSGYAKFLADARKQRRFRTGGGDQFHVFIRRHFRQQIPHVIVR